MRASVAASRSANRTPAIAAARGVRSERLIGSSLSIGLIRIPVSFVARLGRLRPGVRTVVARRVDHRPTRNRPCPGQNRLAKRRPRGLLNTPSGEPPVHLGNVGSTKFCLDPKPATVWFVLDQSARTTMRTLYRPSSLTKSLLFLTLGSRGDDARPPRPEEQAVVDADVPEDPPQPDSTRAFCAAFMIGGLMSGCCRGVQIKRSAGVALSLSLAVLLVSTPRARAEIDPATVPIDHLLVIYLENHTFDNLFGPVSYTHLTLPTILLV